MQHASLSERKRGFNIHALVFVLTLPVLAVINFLVGAPYWVVWVLLGWGIGLAAHWFFVLGPGARDSETR
jgi:hypothetical protein